VRSPNSYVVEFEDGSRGILHANHLRKFHTRTQSSTYTASLIIASTNSCAIIYDSDEEFGEICAPNMVEGSKQRTEIPSQKIDRNLFAHLTPKQQQELLQLSDKYADSFRRFQSLQRVQSIVLN